MGNPSTAFSRWAFPVAFSTLFSFFAWNYFVGIQHFPHHHGDEYSLLTIPYRFSNYGDLRSPVFWSSSFGGQEIRCSPPIAAFTLRNFFHAGAGFSPTLSRIFSALLFFLVMLSLPFFLRRVELNRWQALLVVSQVALAGPILLCGRSMRTEQEILFAGWFGAVALPGLIPTLALRWTRGVTWVGAGFLLGLAGASHPIGVAHGAAGLWLIATARHWHEWDGFRLWERLILLGLGMTTVGAPTITHLMREETRAYVTYVTELYQVRDQQMTPLLASLPPWNRLQPVLPAGAVARLNVVHAAAYADFFDYPVAAYRFRPLLIAWFYGQLLLVLGYFGYSLRCRFQNANPWIHLPVLLAVSFLLVNLCFFPVFTYNIYLAFYVNLAGGVLIWWLATRSLNQSGSSNTSDSTLRVRLSSLTKAVLVGVAALHLHYGAIHAWRVTSAVYRGDFPNVSIDQEFATLKEMSRQLKLNGDDQVVYTSTESWIAAGRNPESLWEVMTLGLVEPRPDAAGVVFKNTHINFFLGSFGADQITKFPSRQQRVELLGKALGRQHLRGLILCEWDQADAYSLYTAVPPPSNQLLVARMRRLLKTDYHQARLLEEIQRPEKVTLPKGQYVLCAWTETDPRDAILEVRQSADPAKSVRVYMGSLFTVAPVPIYLEVTNSSEQFELDCRAADQSIPIRKLQLFRLTPLAE